MVGASQVGLVDRAIFLAPVCEFDKSILLRDIRHRAYYRITYSVVSEVFWVEATRSNRCHKGSQTVPYLWVRGEASAL